MDKFRINEIHGTKGGVYKLHCYLPDDSKDVMPTNRILGTDDQGVLYIGKADSFLERVIDLKKSLLPNYKTDNHGCGSRYWNQTHTNFRVQFPMYRLFVSLIQSDDPGKFEKAEFNNY